MTENRDGQTVIIEERDLNGARERRASMLSEMDGCPYDGPERRIADRRFGSIGSLALSENALPQDNETQYSPLRLVPSQRDEPAIEGNTTNPEWIDFPRPYVSAEYFKPFYVRSPIQLEGLGDGETTIRVFHGSMEPENSVANDIEVGEMVRLGDPEEISENEFTAYFDKSIVVTVQVGDRTVGMLRMTPYDKELGLKMFNDIVENSEDPNETREHVQQTWLKDTGLDTLETTWEVMTLAVDPSITLADQPEQRLDICHLLLVGVNDACFNAIAEQRVTHFVSANDRHMYRALQWMQYPMQGFNGYEIINYPSKDDKPGMKCVPAYFTTRDLIARMRDTEGIDQLVKDRPKLEYFTKHLQLTRYVLRTLEYENSSL